jgi:hypothetical protein
MSKYQSKISQKATYLRVYEGGRMLYGDEVTDVIHNLEKRIVELEKELEKQLKPDLFWPENEGEIGFDDAHEAIGSMVDGYGAILGSMFTLDRAVKLSSQTYVLTEFDESTGSFEYEALKEPKQ